MRDCFVSFTWPVGVRFTGAKRVLALFGVIAHPLVIIVRNVFPFKKFVCDRDAS